MHVLSADLSISQDFEIAKRRWSSQTLFSLHRARKWMKFLNVSLCCHKIQWTCFVHFPLNRFKDPVRGRTRESFWKAAWIQKLHWLGCQDSVSKHHLHQYVTEVRFWLTLRNVDFFFSFCKVYNLYFNANVLFLLGQNTTWMHFHTTQPSVWYSLLWTAECSSKRYARQGACVSVMVQE